MALGFGFNKAKVLAQAEKCVQQGKLPNAIAEYEKIIREDSRDMTVLNTVGDLYARVGENERATHCFKKVGDQYAQDGFTVKAIAIYKKLTKLSPSSYEYISKLADLYSQQGLFNDARAQYMQVADHLLRSGDNSQAARIFQRILELDPENTLTQTKLADLYMKLGKKAEARNIYYTAAEALHARGLDDQADEALTRVLALDPTNQQAILLRGMIAADGGDSPSAVKYLGQLPDLDAHPDGLRALLRAKLQSGDTEGAEEVATKLLTRHNDISGLTGLAELYLGSNRVPDALKLFDRYQDRFLASDRAHFQTTLNSLIDRIKDNPEALKLMSRLMQRGADTSRDAELMEMQAHACVQKGDLHQARDLYLKLSQIEPENALHSQSYRQVLARLGEDSVSRDLSPEEATQAFMLEELDEGTAVHQSYDPPTEQAIEAALTDAELFVSYNVPGKAIPPLEAVLPMAPRDVALNQRLAMLYARGERYADAARVCQVLSDVYHELGHAKDAARYQEAARKYSLRAPGGAPAVARATAAVPHTAPPPPLPPIAMAPQAPVEVDLPTEAPSVQEFSFDVPDHLMTEAAAAPAPAEPPPPRFAEMSVAASEPAVNGAEPPPVALSPAKETDHSGEWESMLSVDEEEVPSRSHVPEMQVITPVELKSPAEAPSPADAATSKIEEIRFYISQQMWDPAKKAILDLTEISPDAPEVTELIAAVSAGQAKAAAAPAQAAHLPPPAAVPVFEHMETPAPAGEEFPLEVEDNQAQVPRAEFRMETAPPPAPEAVAPPEPRAGKPAPKPTKDSPLQNIFSTPPKAPAPRPAAAPPRPPAVPDSPRVTQSKPAPPLEPAATPLDDILDIPQAPKPAKRGKAQAPAAAAKEKSTEDILSDFVLDLEKTELADFVPRAKPEPIAPAPVATIATPQRNARKNGDMQDAESASVLNDILAELQEETAGEAEPGEDPETHYNLGIAFKEMGLLDEAIGELQKVCHALDKGNAFSQPIQAYTWLAQCLVDKGAPEAAVRWYQKALHLPSLDDGSRCAIYYDLAQAYEASGDRKSALANFMEVYGSNIDFRDVASRIKALKS
jgi:tetratricopeptide (TPR) repeat protein